MDLNNFFKWLNLNKEWIFSGVGISILIILWKSVQIFYNAISTKGQSIYDVFISYSHKDKALCEALISALESRKISFCTTPQGMLSGENYSRLIDEAINNSRLFVLIISSESNKSPHIIKEIERAIKKRIKILPVRIENIPLSRGLKDLIKNQQLLNAYTSPPEKHITELVDIIQIVLSKKNNRFQIPLIILTPFLIIICCLYFGFLISNHSKSASSAKNKIPNPPETTPLKKDDINSNPITTDNPDEKKSTQKEIKPQTYFLPFDGKNDVNKRYMKSDDPIEQEILNSFSWVNKDFKGLELGDNLDFVYYKIQNYDKDKNQFETKIFNLKTLCELVFKNNKLNKIKLNIGDQWEFYLQEDMDFLIYKEIIPMFTRLYGKPDIFNQPLNFLGQPDFSEKVGPPYDDYQHSWLVSEWHKNIKIIQVYYWYNPHCIGYGASITITPANLSPK